MQFVVLIIITLHCLKTLNQLLVNVNNLEFLNSKTLVLIAEHGRRQRGARGRGPPEFSYMWSPLNFHTYGTDIVDRGLLVLFSVFFLLFYDLFFLCTFGNFSADALVAE